MKHLHLFAIMALAVLVSCSPESNENEKSNDNQTKDLKFKCGENGLFFLEGVDPISAEQFSEIALNSGWNMTCCLSYFNGEIDPLNSGNLVETIGVSKRLYFEDGKVTEYYKGLDPKAEIGVPGYFRYYYYYKYTDALHFFWHGGDSGRCFVICEMDDKHFTCIDPTGESSFRYCTFEKVSGETVQEWNNNYTDLGEF